VESRKVPPGKKPTPAACVLDPLKSITGPSILPQVQEDLLLRKRWFVSDPKICFDHIIDLSPLSRKFWPDQNFFSFTKKRWSRKKSEKTYFRHSGEPRIGSGAGAGIKLNPLTLPLSSANGGEGGGEGGRIKKEIPIQSSY